MSCPFLRETRVWGCRSAQVRKLIPRAGTVPPDTACLTEGHLRCPGFVNIDALQARTGKVCPFLEDSLAQYCAAAPVLKLIPYSEAMLVRCGSEAYRFCDLYLEQAGPATGAALHGEEFNVPESLLYADECWWLDLPDEGPWHAGLDAFAARLTGPVERVSYIPASPGAPPAVVLTVADRDYTFCFPERLTVTASNPILRLHPERIWESPYARGWIYEGTATGAQRDELRSRLAGPREARRRMEDAARFVNERIQLAHNDKVPALGDGGLFEPGLLKRLSRDEARSIMHALFSNKTSISRI